MATKSKEAEEVDEVEVALEMPDNIIALELIPNKRDCVVLYASMSLTEVTRNQRIK